MKILHNSPTSGSTILNRSTPPDGFDFNDVLSPPLREKKWPLLSLALDISGTCNLACRYCAENTTQPPRDPMDWRVLEGAWNFLSILNPKWENTSIRFGSGEPLLAFSLLKKFNTLIKAAIGNSYAFPKVFITTNGTLINAAVGEWLASSGWNIKISLDGPKKIHDSFRITRDGTGTYFRISKNIKKLSEILKNRLSVTAVLCKGADPQRVFSEIAKLGVKKIELVPVVHNDESFIPDEFDQAQYQFFVQRYAQTFIESKNIENVPILVRFAEKVLRVMGYNNLRVPCGAGRSFFGIGPDGGIYPCFRFIGINKYRLGNLVSGINSNDIASFRDGPGKPYDMRQSCQTCWAAPLCGGPCFSCSEFFGPGKGEPLDYHCSYILADARAAIWLVNYLRKMDPVRLLRFIPEGKKLL